jgi:hypothetical protein
MASSDVAWPVAIYATEAEALAACAKIDVAMGLPNKRMTRWTDPLPLEDGTWAVQYPDRAIAATTKATLSARVATDLAALRKRTAEEVAEADVKPAKRTVKP